MSFQIWLRSRNLIQTQTHLTRTRGLKCEEQGMEKGIAGQQSMVKGVASSFVPQNMRRFSTFNRSKPVFEEQSTTKTNSKVE